MVLMSVSGLVSEGVLGLPELHPLRPAIIAAARSSVNVLVKSFFISGAPFQIIDLSSLLVIRGTALVINDLLLPIVLGRGGIFSHPPHAVLMLSYIWKGSKLRMYRL